MTTASLGMYDHPWVQPHNDRWWSELRALVTDLQPPAYLNRSTPLAQQWHDPQLFLSQTCGYPYMTRHYDVLQLISTPIYTATGCADGNYTSVVLAHRDGVKAIEQAKHFVINSRDSLSGALAMEFALADSGFKQNPFSRVLMSGGHYQSMQMVADLKADLCCIDAVTYALIVAGDSGLGDKLSVLQHTRQFPGLPLVTATGRSEEFVGRLQNALQQLVIEGRARKALDALTIRGFKTLTDEDYISVIEQHQLLPDAIRGCFTA